MRGRRRRRGGRRRRRGRRLGWQSLTLPLTMLVQACEGFGLASMGTPVVQLTVVFEIYIYIITIRGGIKKKLFFFFRKTPKF